MKNHKIFILLLLLLTFITSCKIKNETKYIVNFDSSGGSVVNSVEVIEGQKLEKPFTPTRIGYEFDDWYIDEIYTEVYDFNSPVLSNMTLYAKWEEIINTYNVCLNSMGGKFSNNDSTLVIIVNEGTLASLETPTNDGYTFSGWYFDEDYYNPFNPNTLIKNDITLFAKWTEVSINTYTVTFNVDGVIDTQNVIENECVTPPQDPEKEGYKFVGWFTSLLSETKFDFTSLITRNINLYAKWEKLTLFDVLASTNVIVKEDFNSYTSSDKIPTFSEEYGTEGIFYRYNVKSGSGSQTTNYITLGSGYANLVDNSDGGTQLIVDLGKNYTTNIIEGYVDIKLINQGDSWTPVQFLGYNSNNEVVEVLGLRLKNGLINYRLFGASDSNLGVANTSVVADNITYKIHYIFDLNNKTTYLSLNDKVLINNVETNINSLAAIKFVSSDGNKKTLTVDNIVVVNNDTRVDYDSNEYCQVIFETNGGSSISTEKVVLGGKISRPEDPTRPGYEFINWYSDPYFISLYSFDDVITNNIIIYAKWRSTSDLAITYTVKFESNGGSSVLEQIVEETKSVIQPDAPTRDGYSFVGWYTSQNFDELYNFNASVTCNMTLYARWIESTTVDLTEIKSDIIYNLNEYAQEKIELFNEIDDVDIISAILADVNAFTTKINACENEADIHLQLAQAKDAINELVKNYYDNKGDEGTENSVVLVESEGSLETAYVEWLPVQSATSYNVYYKLLEEADSKYKKIDMMLIRSYGSYYRADVLGLKAGEYTIKVVPIINANEASFTATTNVNVLAHDRSGYAFVNGSSSGGYNDDGTPKSDAVIIYITENTKDSVVLDVTTSSKGAITNCVGLTNILLGFKKGHDKRPLIVRFIGNISDFATMNKGDICIDDCQNGITFEGVGNDATANGWGIRIKNSSNVEIRNLGVMNVDSNEGDNIGLQQDNDHIWIHNNDIFYGHAGSDSDQAKGDGALDTKTSSYVTHSYNHFWDCGKCNLQGMKSESTENYITYHHNWYDHSDSRHPRIRTCTVHIYNNFYDGNSKYGVGVTMGASAFVENNYFRNCKNPMLSSLQGTDALGEGTFSGEAGGIIKAYGNYIEGGNPIITYADNNTSFDCYVVSSRYETIPASVVTLVGGTSYNNFDSAGSFYTYKVDTPEEAVANIKLYCGRVQGGDFKWTFNNSVDDESYDVNPALKAALISYETKLIKILGEN